MNPADILKIIKEDGGWGLAALLVVVVGIQYRRNVQLTDRIFSSALEIKDALAGVTKAIVALTLAFENTNRLNEERLNALREMSSQIGPLASATSRMGALIESMNSSIQGLIRDLAEISRDIKALFMVRGRD